MTFQIFIEFITVPLVLLGAMAAALEFGARMRGRHQAEHGDAREEGLSVIDGAVFGLMGLLLAFAFSGAASRFDARRDLIVEEANDIGTAYLRVDLLPAADQPEMRQLFRDYLESRIDTFRDVRDPDLVKAAMARSNVLQTRIWRLAVTSTGKATSTVPGMLLLGSLNDMFDITTDRAGAMLMHPPAAVYLLLMLVMVLSSALAGYRIGASDHGSRLHRVVFVLILGITYYVIVDLEFPRIGLIQVDDFDVMMIGLRQSMMP